MDRSRLPQHQQDGSRGDVRRTGASTRVTSDNTSTTRTRVNSDRASNELSPSAQARPPPTKSKSFVYDPRGSRTTPSSNPTTNTTAISPRRYYTPMASPATTAPQTKSSVDPRANRSPSARPSTSPAPTTNRSSANNSPAIVSTTPPPTHLVQPRARSTSPHSPQRSRMSEASLWELARSLQEELGEHLHKQLEAKALIVSLHREREELFKKLQMIEDVCSERKESLVARQMLSIVRRPERGFQETS